MRAGLDAEQAARLQALHGQAQALRAALEGRNEKMKGVIDELRSMLNSMALWDTYKRQLDLHKQATE